MADEGGLGSDAPPEFGGFPYGKKDKTKTYREIVLEAIEKCRVEFSKQMTKGGEYMLESGLVITAADQRQVCINTVETLWCLLLFTFDDEAKNEVGSLLDIYDEKVDKEKLGTLSEKIMDLTQKYFDKYLEKEWFKPYQEQAKKEGRMVEGVKSHIAPFITQQRDDECLRLYKRVYVSLLELFKRKKELSMKRVLGAYD